MTPHIEQYADVLAFAQRAQRLALSWVERDPAVRLPAVWDAISSVPFVATDEGRAATCAIVNRIAQQFHSSIPAQDVLTGGIYRSASGNPRVAVALNALVRRHGESGLSLGAIAREARMSRSRLSHLITAHTGCGLLTHLNGIRVLNAARLLRTTLLSVKEVSAQVGYSHTSALDHQFHRWLRISPSQFRLWCDRTRDAGRRPLC